MSGQIQITLRHVEHSEALAARIRRLAAKLERVHAGIVSCRVTVEAPPRHQHQGSPFVVRLDIRIPGGEIVVNREHSEDLYLALRDAFEAAGRQLEDRAGRRRAGVKGHRARAEAAVGDADE
jgi:ribosomal subunit interface protein